MRHKQKFVVIISLMLITLTSCMEFKKSKPNLFKEISTVEEFDEFLTQTPYSTLLIDLRDEKDYISGHVPGSSNFPFTDEGEALLRYLENFSKDKPIVLMCYSGNRSAKAFGVLVRNNYTNITDFTVGYNNYKQSKGDSFTPETGDCGCPK